MRTGNLLRHLGVDSGVSWAVLAGVSFGVCWYSVRLWCFVALGGRSWKLSGALWFVWGSLVMLWGCPGNVQHFFLLLTYELLPHEPLQLVDLNPAHEQQLQPNTQPPGRPALGYLTT